MRIINKIRFSILLCITIASTLLTGCSEGIFPSNGDNVFDIGKIGKETVEGNSRFAFDLFRQLNTEEENKSLFISPISISTALTMTYQGAGSTTKEVMAKTLGYSGIDDATLNESYSNLLRYLKNLDKKVELNIGNSLWIREGETIREEFISANKDYFDASVTPLDFSQKDAADQINKWISNATEKKIDKMIDSPISPDIVMYLINAIYFKGDWTKQFDTKNTFDTQFHKEDGSNAEVKMMSRNGKLEYGHGDGYKAVRLPYGSGKAAMYCILPEEGNSVHELINSLNLEKWTAIRESISEKEDVHLQLPRFKLEYGIKNLNDSLTALGMGEAFTDVADFSGIREELSISRVLHKAVIEVNEEGSEAAAATVVEMKETAVAVPLTFVADRPFVFIIADDDTDTILFAGKLYGEAF